MRMRAIRRRSSWHRIDNATSPTRFPSSIYPDPDQREPCLGHLLRLTTPRRPPLLVTSSTCSKAAGSGLGLVHEPPGRTRHGDVPDADRHAATCRSTISSATTQKRSYDVATDFGVVRGNNDGNGRLARNAGPAALRDHAPRRSSRRPGFRPASGSGKKDCPTLIYAATHSQGVEAASRAGRNRCSLIAEHT